MTHPINTAKTIDQVKRRHIVDPIQDMRDELVRLREQRPLPGSMDDWRMNYLEGYIACYEEHCV